MKKEKKLNNKGFTLIEVLAVIVILVIIVSIAIPNISASLDRQSKTIIENKGELVASAAQFYVSDNRATVKNKVDVTSEGKCKIETCVLKGQDIESSSCVDAYTQNNEKYITANDLKGNNNDTFDGFVVYDASDESYTFCFDEDTKTAYEITNNAKCSTSGKCY